MARLHVLALDARLPAWAEAACADYERRMPKGYALARTPIKLADLKSLPTRHKGARLVALDERGEERSTAQFARLLSQETAFVIGGADGLPDDFRKSAALLLRLSAMTLPHALAQVVLVEQIYRAATLLVGHPYHRS